MRNWLTVLRCVQWTLAAVMTGALGLQPLAAQSPAAATSPKTFEVASIKPHTSTDPRVSMVAEPSGRFTAINVPLRFVIRTAYSLQDDQIVGRLRGRRRTPSATGSAGSRCAGRRFP